MIHSFSILIVHLLIKSVLALRKYNIILNDDVSIASSDGSGSVIALLNNSTDKIIKRTKLGYTAELSDKTYKKVKKHPGVAIIEEDKPVKIASFSHVLTGNSKLYESILLSDDSHRISIPFGSNSNKIHTPFGSTGHEMYTPLSGNKVRPASFGDRNIFDNLYNALITPSYNTGNSLLTFVLQKDSPWGLSRITGNSTNYGYLLHGGENVIVYILDTGVDVDNPEFEGRASFIYNSVEHSSNTDEHGHGTHCAGVIGSKTFGVAKKVKIGAVKVLNEEGTGSISGLIEGIGAVVDDYQRRLAGNGIFRLYNDTLSRGSGLLQNNEIHRNNRMKAIVNMSIGGEKSTALNYAVKHASALLGIHFSTAAGNENNDACLYSPSSSSMSLTIGASDNDNIVAEFSNKGNCVDLYAPGTDILSTWLNSDVKVLSGTSMATPHVTGIMAIYLGLVDFEPEELKNKLISDSVQLIESNYSEAMFWPFTKELKPMASLKKLYDRIKSHRTHE